MDLDKKDELIDRVKNFVAQETGYAIDRISLQTSLASDIGLAGMDADVFFHEFSKTFSVDWESFISVDFEKHFGREGMSLKDGLVAMALCSPFMILAKFLDFHDCAILPFTIIGYYCFTMATYYLQNKFWPPKHDRLAIVVEDLVDAAIARKWVANK